MTKKYFADTYALIEFIKGGINYKQYRDSIILLTKFNLVELYFSLLKEYNEEVADKYVKFYSKYIIRITFSSIKNGMKLKLKYKKDRLSYTDCIGYAIAAENNIKFLTGDQKFDRLPNVEFVK